MGLRSEKSEPRTSVAGKIARKTASAGVGRRVERSDGGKTGCESGCEVDDGDVWGFLVGTVEDLVGEVPFRRLGVGEDIFNRGRFGLCFCFLPLLEDFLRFKVSLKERYGIWRSLCQKFVSGVFIRAKCSEKSVLGSVLISRCHALTLVECF